MNLHSRTQSSNINKVMSEPIKDDDVITTSKDDIWVSMMIDYERSVYNPPVKQNTKRKHHHEPLKKLQHRTRAKWFPDKDAKNCMQCGIAFGYTYYGYRVGIHHGRLCGGVFCDNCSSRRILIPKYITNIPTPDGIPRPIDRNKDMVAAWKKVLGKNI